MSDAYNPWDAFGQGVDIGNNMRRTRQQGEIGRAYREGGADAAFDTAAGQGNFEAADNVLAVQQRREDARTAGMRRLREFGGMAVPALRRAEALPPEQRAGWLNQPHIRSRFEAFGFQPEQIDNAIGLLSDPNTAEEMFANLYAAFQGDGLDWSVIDPATGQIGAVDPNTGTIVEGGTAPVTPGQVQQFGSGGLYRANPQSPQGVEIIREPRSVTSGSGSGAPSGYRWADDGSSLEPIPGGPRDPESQGARPFPADQRARVAISFEPALEAAQQMEAAEAEAVRRQGTHGSNTPFGQDWGARVVEGMIPYDGGSAARLVGGEDYQQYTRASSAFEAAILPILSGAAVTESEAQRIVRAALPRFNDNRETLQAKARQRRQMLNGAAVIGGRPLPYPEDAVADWAQRAANAVNTAPSPGVGLESLTDEQLDALEQELLNGGR